MCDLSKNNLKEKPYVCMLYPCILKHKTKNLRVELSYKIQENLLYEVTMYEVEKHD